MVAEKKKQTVKEIGKIIERYPVVGIVDLYKLPAKQLQEIKKSLGDKALIKTVKKRLISLILRNSKKQGIMELEKRMHGMPAILLSNENPFKLARLIAESKSPAPAKPGDIVEKEIIVSAGPTDLPAGPAIGDLQKIKLPVGVENGKIAVKRDTVVAKPGDEVTKELASALAKLNINPMEIGLNLLAVYENGLIYGKDILFTPIEEYVERVKTAYSHAFNLSLNINYITYATVPFLFSKAYKEAFNLAVKTNYITKETLKPLLVKAKRQADVLKNKVNLELPTEEEKTENNANQSEKKEEEKA